MKLYSDHKNTLIPKLIAWMNVRLHDASTPSQLLWSPRSTGVSVNKECSSQQRNGGQGNALPSEARAGMSNATSNPKHWCHNKHLNMFKGWFSFRNLIFCHTKWLFLNLKFTDFVDWPVFILIWLLLSSLYELLSRVCMCLMNVFLGFQNHCRRWLQPWN